MLLPERAATVLPRLISRYLGDEPGPLASWLLSRVDSEVAIRISDLRVNYMRVDAVPGGMKTPFDYAIHVTMKRAAAARTKRMICTFNA